MRWFEAHPDRLAEELEVMASAAPDLTWDPHLTRPEYDDGGGWSGTVPLWPFDRACPAGLGAFVNGHRFELRVVCLQAHPAVQPRIYPLDPDPDLEWRTSHAWHFNGDGSICLTQRAYDWDGSELVAALVPKLASWFLEYLLLSRGHIEQMTERGIAELDVHDHLFDAAHAQPAP